MVQPLLVSVSAVTLASETVRSILKIDDIVSTARAHAHTHCPSPIRIVERNLVICTCLKPDVVSYFAGELYADVRRVRSSVTKAQSSASDVRGPR